MRSDIVQSVAFSLGISDLHTAPNALKLRVYILSLKEVYYVLESDLIKLPIQTLLDINEALRVISIGLLDLHSRETDRVSVGLEEASSHLFQALNIYRSGRQTKQYFRHLLYCQRYLYKVNELLESITVPEQSAVVQAEPTSEESIAVPEQSGERQYPTPKSDFPSVEVFDEEVLDGTTELEERIKIVEGGELHGPDVESLGGLATDQKRRRGTKTAVDEDHAQERTVSTGFASETQPDVPLDAAMSLRRGQRYYFWLEIGGAVPGSIEEVPTSLPEGLPVEARLTVALFAFPNQIQIAEGEDVGELQLQSDGSAVVRRQPASPSPNLLSEGDLLKQRLLFPVRTPNKSGTFHLRCNIYYEQILIQSRLISVRVTRRPQSEDRALRSVVDYTLSRKLDPAHLVRLEPHRLSLMLNSNGDGTHSFRFLGTQNFKQDATFDGQELQDMLQQARGVLRSASWGDSTPWQKDKTYLYDGPRDLNQLTADLKRFAIRGYRIYDAIINRIAGDPEQVEGLAELMRTPGFVQIALKKSARFIFPAALIYDYDFDTGANLTLCRAFKEALDGSTPLENLECFQGDCPSRGAEDIICPSGFWGYRHYIGLPLSVATGQDTPAEIAYQQSLQFTIGVSTDPALKERLMHEQTLRSLRQNLGWNYANTREMTLTLLKEIQPHVVYFYCHGGVADNVPYIQVGSLNERGITRDNLRYKKIRWVNSRPLVFINGCHTTALEPEMTLEFVSAFVENASASGIIGTEITIFEPLARAFAEECLRRFMDGSSIGEAVRGARLKLLKEGNPLGLVYIPFVMAGLRLTEQTVSK